MEIILAAVAVIIIVAIIAVVLLKKKQAPLDETPTVSQHTPPVATKPEPAPAPAEVAPVQTAPTPIDPLAHAQSLMDEQHYDEAARLIKKTLIANPKNAQAMFKLLQIYGLTSNHSAFTQLHQRIHDLGDAQVIADADELHALLQEDTAQPDAFDTAEEMETVEPATVSGDDFALDFDEFTTTSEQPADTFSLDVEETAPSGEPKEDDFALDFDEAPSAGTDDQGLDFSFDDQTQTNDQDDLNLEDDEPTTDELSFDLGSALDDNADTQSTHDEPADDTLTFDTADSLAAAGDFDLGDEFALTDEPAANEKVDEQPTPSDEFASDEFDFETLASADGLDLGGESAAEPQQDSDEFNFELDGDNFDLTDTPTTQSPAPETKEDDGEFLLDDEFDFSGTDDTDVQTEVTQTFTQQADSFNLDDDFDLGDTSFETQTDELGDGFALQDEANSFDLRGETDGFELTQEPKIADLQDETDSLELPQNTDSFELTGDETLIEQAGDTDDTNSDTLDDGFLLNDDFGADSSGATDEIAEEPVATRQTAPSDAPNSTSGLGFVDGLDSAEITLSLAQQYIDLGEHDSAKRLLTEVVQSGSDAQQQRANKLLTHII